MVSGNMGIFQLVFTLAISPGLEVIKLFSCSNQLSMKFQLLIKTKMLKSKFFLL